MKMLIWHNETHLLFPPFLAGRRDHFRFYTERAKAQPCRASLPSSTCFWLHQTSLEGSPQMMTQISFLFCIRAEGRYTTLHCPGHATSRNSCLGIGREMPRAGHLSCGGKPRGKSEPSGDCGHLWLAPFFVTATTSPPSLIPRRCMRHLLSCTSITEFTKVC